MKTLNFSISLGILLTTIYLFGKAQPWGLEFFRKSFSPGAGGEILPIEIREMSDILMETGRNEFSLAADLSGDVYMYQRTVEYLYPYRIISDGKVFFTTKPTSEGTNCREISKASRVYLYECH